MRHINAQFFGQFAHQRRFGGFALLDLAARKFPHACHGAPHRALGHKHAPVCVDQRAGDDQNKAVSFGSRH